MLKKIISDGSQGVGIAALRAAAALGLETGGYMREGFNASFAFSPEPMPERAALYGLTEFVRNEKATPPALAACWENDKIAQDSLCLQFVNPQFLNPFKPIEDTPIHRREWPQYYQLKSKSGLGTWLTRHDEQDSSILRVVRKAPQYLNDLRVLLAPCEVLHVSGDLYADEDKAEWFLITLFRDLLDTPTPTTGGTA